MPVSVPVPVPVPPCEESEGEGDMVWIVVLSMRLLDRKFKDGAQQGSPSGRLARTGSGKLNYERTSQYFHFAASTHIGWPAGPGTRPHPHSPSLTLALTVTVTRLCRAEILNNRCCARYSMNDAMACGVYGFYGRGRGNNHHTRSLTHSDSLTHSLSAVRG
jgi:hypothetical protein